MDEKRDEQRLPRSVGQQYTAEERAAVPADVPALCCKPAAAKHGVPVPNIFRWARAAGITKASSSDETPTALAAPASPPPPVVIAKAKVAPARRKSTASAKAAPPSWTGNKSPGATDLPAATPASSPVSARTSLYPCLPFSAPSMRVSFSMARSQRGVRCLASGGGLARGVGSPRDPHENRASPSPSTPPPDIMRSRFSL